MQTALEVRSQLVDLCGRHGVDLVSNGDSRAVRRALLVGLHTQTAEHAGEGKYRTVRLPTSAVVCPLIVYWSYFSAGHKTGSIYPSIFLSLPSTTSPILCHVLPTSSHYQVLHEVRDMPSVYSTSYGILHTGIYPLWMSTGCPINSSKTDHCDSYDSGH